MYNSWLYNGPQTLWLCVVTILLCMAFNPGVGVRSSSKTHYTVKIVFLVFTFPEHCPCLSSILRRKDCCNVLQENQLNISKCNKIWLILTQHYVRCCVLTYQTIWHEAPVWKRWMKILDSWKYKSWLIRCEWESNIGDMKTSEDSYIFFVIPANMLCFFKSGVGCRTPNE